MSDRASPPPQRMAPPLQGQDISIVGHDRVKVDEGPIPSHILVYVVKINWGLAPWTLRKRYSDFEDFQRRLVFFYGPKQVPYLTGKKKLPVGQTSQKFAEKRTRKLERYMREVTDEIERWFVEPDMSLPTGDAILAGLGINPLLFDFFEFKANAQIPAPQNPEYSPKRVVMAQSRWKSQIRQLMKKEDHSELIKATETIGIDEDDRKPVVLEEALRTMKAQSKLVDMSCLQAREIVETAFFGACRVKVCKVVVPFISDPENKRRVLDVIDFDDDILLVEGMFHENEQEKMAEDASRKLPPKEPSQSPSKDGGTEEGGSKEGGSREVSKAPSGVEHPEGSLEWAIAMDFDTALSKLENFRDLLDIEMDDEVAGVEVTVDWARERWSQSAPEHAILRSFLSRRQAEEPDLFCIMPDE